jgi:hypothetical protein
METFRGDCVLFRYGEKVCAALYEIYRQTIEGKIIAEVGRLEVNGFNKMELATLINRTHVDPEFQLIINMKNYAIRLRTMDASANFEKGYALFIFSVMNPNGGW